MLMFLLSDRFEPHGGDIVQPLILNLVKHFHSSVEDAFIRYQQ